MWSSLEQQCKANTSPATLFLLDLELAVDEPEEVPVDEPLEGDQLEEATVGESVESLPLDAASCQGEMAFCYCTVLFFRL